MPHGGQAKHLGVHIGHDAAACSHAIYERLISGLRMRVEHWSAKRLSFLRCAHVAKQVLGASIWNNAMFVRPSANQLQRIINVIMAFVAGKDAAATMSACLFPNRLVSALDWGQGGVRLVDVDAMIVALPSLWYGCLVMRPCHGSSSLLSGCIGLPLSWWHTLIWLPDQLTSSGLALAFCSRHTRLDLCRYLRGREPI